MPTYKVKWCEYLEEEIEAQNEADAISRIDSKNAKFIKMDSLEVEQIAQLPKEEEFREWPTNDE